MGVGRLACEDAGVRPEGREVRVGLEVEESPACECTTIRGDQGRHALGQPVFAAWTAGATHCGSGAVRPTAPGRRGPAHKTRGD